VRYLRGVSDSANRGVMKQDGAERRARRFDKGQSTRCPPAKLIRSISSTCWRGKRRSKQSFRSPRRRPQAAQSDVAEKAGAGIELGANAGVFVGRVRGRVLARARGRGGGGAETIEGRRSRIVTCGKGDSSHVQQLAMRPTCYPQKFCGRLPCVLAPAWQGYGVREHSRPFRPPRHNTERDAPEGLSR